MKRFAKVALLAAMMFGCVATASAGELKARAAMDVYAQWSQNLYDLNADQSDDDNSLLAQRARMYFDYISSKDLKMVMGFEMDQDWGAAGSNLFGYDQKGAIEIKHAYLDFTIPETVVNIKAGLQPVALPGVFGSPIFDEDAHSLVVTAPVTDQVAVSAGFLRGKDTFRASTHTLVDPTDPDSDPIYGRAVSGDEVDVAFLAVPVKVDGFKATPYLVYGSLGSKYVATITDDANAEGSSVWWLGANAELSLFDPFTLEADLIYGAAKNDEEAYEAKGWYAALAASYKFDMVTPKLFATYGSGNNDDASDGLEAMPTVIEGFGYTPNTGTRAFSTTYDSWADRGYMADGTGMWSVGLQLLDMSFVDKLSHELTVAYMKGTGSLDVDGTDVSYFTKDDSAFEIYLMNKYMIFENLAAIVELDYFKANLEDRNSVETADDASAYIAAGFQYKF